MSCSEDTVNWWLQMFQDGILGRNQQQKQRSGLKKQQLLFAFYSEVHLQVCQILSWFLCPTFDLVYVLLYRIITFTKLKKRIRLLVIKTRKDKCFRILSKRCLKLKKKFISQIANWINIFIPKFETAHWTSVRS